MSFAFSALVLLLIYLPGALYFFAYWGRLSKDSELPVLSAALSAQAVKVFIAASILQALWIYLGFTIHSWGWSSTLPQPHIFLTLLGGTVPDEYQKALAWTANNLWPLFLYFATLFIFAGLLGFVLHRLVRHFELDKKYTWLRFSNRWHYLLSKEAVKSKGGTEVDVFLHALIEIGGTQFIYGGRLFSDYFDSKGELEGFLLGEATRTPLNAPPATLGTTEVIPNITFLHLKCTEVKNLGIQYVQVKKK